LRVIELACQFTVFGGLSLQLLNMPIETIGRNAQVLRSPTSNGLGSALDVFL